MSPMSRVARSFPGSRRFVLLGAVAAAIVGLWVVGRWATAPSYVSLYHDLDLAEAGAIAERLTKTNIPYRLGTGGTEVLVPVAEAARARVTLAKDGLPTNGRPGLELFDKPAWGMTDFTQRVTYQRALEGELARTIGSLRGVKRAEVHLVLPAESPLRRLERSASASVVLTLQPGATLAPDAVQGITYIVSNSVEQLPADNVAVMDDGGHVLSVPSADGASVGLTTRQLEIQRAVEERLTTKVEDLLATVIGNGRARAKVAAQLSFDQVDRTVETFDPDRQVLQTEQRSESEGGGQGPDGGTQTIVSNAYQNSRSTEKSVTQAGKVERLTVAVLVDEKALRGAGSPKIETLESMVRDAIGADSTRGDRVSVMALPFEAAPAPGPGGASSTDKPKTDVIVIAERWSRPAVGVVAVAVMLVLALQALRLTGGMRGGAGGPARDEAAEPLAPSLPAANGTSPAALLRNRLSAESAERPETTAQVVRAWLAES